MKVSSMKDILVHHGILGQKWGVRRYQEEDGSLTSLGKKRYLTNSTMTKDALDQDRTVLKMRAAYRQGLATSKDARQSALAKNHPDRYKTAREMYNEVSKETGKLKQHEAALVKSGLEYLKEAGLDNVKGVSVATTRNSERLGDVSVSYRYYNDDQEEPTYYPTVQSLKAAIEQEEKEKKKKKKKKARQELQSKISNDVKNKIGQIVNTVKSIPSSVLSTTNSAVSNGKSIVSNILKKLGR